MKFVGHTMGTPQQTVAEAIELYSSVNLDAIEIACQEGVAFWIGVPDELVKKVMGAKYVRSYGGFNKAGGTDEENWAKTVEAL